MREKQKLKLFDFVKEDRFQNALQDDAVLMEYFMGKESDGKGSGGGEEERETNIQNTLLFIHKIIIPCTAML